MTAPDAPSAPPAPTGASGCPDSREAQRGAQGGQGGTPVGRPPSPMMAASEPLTVAARRVDGVRASTERVVAVEHAQRVLDEAVEAARIAEAEGWNRDLTDLGRRYDTLVEAAQHAIADMIEIAEVSGGFRDLEVIAKRLSVAVDGEAPPVDPDFELRVRSTALQLAIDAPAREAGARDSDHLVARAKVFERYLRTGNHKVDRDR